MRAYKANMIPGGVTPTINVSQYDNDYAVTVTLIEGAEIYTPPVGATIRVEGTKPDGHGFEYACTYQGNVVTMPIYTQMTAVSGRFPIELVVYQSGLRVGSCNIIFAVEKAPLGEDTDISETVIPDIIAGAQAQADAAASSAASAETAKDAAMDAAQDAIDAAQELQTAIQFNAALIHDTASGAVASFSDGADDIPMQSLVTEITPVQSGSGDPSPTNIRPISGRTGMTVTRAGKNLLNQETVVLSNEGSWAINSPFPSPIKPGSYVFSVVASVTGGMTFYIADNDGTRIVQTSFSVTAGTRVQVPVTLNGVGVKYGGYYNMGGTLSDFQLEVGSTATAYEPYVGQTYPITWESIAGTVYGGTLDVVSGVLTVNRATRKVAQTDTTRLFGALNDNCNRVGIVTYGMKKPSWNVSAEELNIVSNIAIASLNPLHSASAAIPWECALYADGIYNIAVFAVPSSYNTAALARQALVDNGCEYTYPLATPQTYQLTPTEVRTILGGNTIYTDAGGVTVEYVADTKLYIDNKIAELQALVLEN